MSSRQAIRSRLFCAALDLAQLESALVVENMSDDELLAIIESNSEHECGFDFRGMSDRELEGIVYGSSKTRKEIIDNHLKRRP
ncbi:MAG: hypothetical protein VB050_08160 [Geobacteraceae bacterium]|nr:hypothetical protein [Geobacteraceae bacterium]